MLLKKIHTSYVWFMENKGIFLQVKEKHTFSSEGAKVSISFNIEEKGRYYIEKIKITGNDKTRDNVIRRQLTFHPGERLDTEKYVTARGVLQTRDILIWNQVASRN